MKNGYEEIKDDVGDVGGTFSGRKNYLFSESHEGAEGFLQKYLKLLENTRQIESRIFYPQTFSSLKWIKPDVLGRTDTMQKH